MTHVLQRGLSSKNGLLRKSAAALLTLPKWLSSLRAHDADYAHRPPVLANSVPKSGTHLLVQIVEGLPDRANYGSFLASMTSSFQYRQRSPESVRRFIRRIAPGEIVRGHLFYSPEAAEQLRERNVVNYFIYRDPRDVALSGAHYARSMNRWHKLHRYFCDKSIEDAITIAIRGLNIANVDFPNIAERFAKYRGWRTDTNCLAIRFEDLQSDARPEVVSKILEFYAAHCDGPIDMEPTRLAMLNAVAPSKSHTFRKGEKGGWRKAFTAEQRRLFHEIAGDLLLELGYENDSSWVDLPQEAVA